jgi:RES domain-containing protein
LALASPGYAQFFRKADELLEPEKAFRFSARAAGILVPSFAINATPEMTNLVLWRWGDAAPSRLVLIENRLSR